MKNPVLAPSVLSADLGKLAEQVKAAETGGADWLHVDIMDGQFVPPITFGANMVAALRKISTLPLDVHLMVKDPERFVAAYADAGASVFTFHPEATVHSQRLLASIRARGMKAGFALNPGSPLTLAEELLDDIDLLLIMSVNPGFGGQDYIASATEKLKRARALLTARKSAAVLEVDGGISGKTITTAWQAGAEAFAIGSAVFGAKDISGEVKELRRRCSDKV
ncbi:MAG: ribulose-phosphate 3-epimerase [Gemmatimonadetes bacterium]|nr:ribulose-phosphate 3-epimerase [Gemmatimonadota bacterium]